MLSRFHRPATVLALALLASCESAPTDPPLTAASRAELPAPPVSLEWQHEARNVVATRNMSALAAGRLFAAVGMAALHAVEAVDAETPAGDSDGQGYGTGGRARYEARRGAVASASAAVLGWFAPPAAATFAQLVATQGGARPHPAFLRGVALGQAAAADILQHVSSDGFTTPWSGTIPTGPGLWTTTAPPAGATLGGVTPYFIESAEQFRPAPPPAYLSPAFNADLAAVLAVRRDLTPAQNAIALGWAYGANTFTPIGYWNQLASVYVAEAAMDEAAAARVFGLMGASVFDALITTFSAKYFYWTLRPHQADPAITTSFPVPNYPAYPSGHGSVSAASARVLAHYFPNRAAELNALVEEAAMSRIYAGIHYFFDMTAARASGEAVADWVLSQSLQ